MLLSAFRLAISSIAGNVLRSFLTILGIIIGVAAVITMTAIVATAWTAKTTNP